jgi:hypothetical protein
MGGRFYHAEVSSLPSWNLSNLFFAKEPEPHVDLEIEDPGTAHTPSSPFGAPAPQRPPRLQMLILIVLLLVVAGAAYFMMDPELVMKLTGQEQPAPAVATPPVTAVQPTIVPRSSPSDRTVHPEGFGAIVPPGTIPTPSFGEGQRVSVVPNSASPGVLRPLSQDAAGTKPGPMVGLGETLRVLDAELHENTWVYLVRTDEGAKGWIAENQLTAKP